MQNITVKIIQLIFLGLLFSFSIVWATAKSAKFLGTPCRNFQILDGTIFLDPKDGREKLALNSFVAGGKGALILLDYSQNRAERYDFPAHSGGRTILQVSDTRLIVASEYAGAFLPFDLVSRQWDTAKIGIGPDNEYTWMLNPGFDGWIYSGGYPHPNLYRYHPKTGQTEDLGEMLGERNLYNRFVTALPNGWIINSVGFEKFALVAFNPQNKEKRILPFDVGQCVRMKLIGKYILATWKGRIHFIDSETFAEVEPDFLPKPPSQNGTWTNFKDFSIPSNLYLTADDGVLYRFNIKDKSLEKIWNLTLRGGAIRGIDSQNRLVGTRGQDYFVASLLDTTLKLQHIPAKAPATEIIFLAADPAGGVVGGSGFGQTLFHFDPARNIAQNTATVVDAGGEVYDGKFLHNKFYFTAYSKADVGVWEPLEEWDQWNNRNPRKITSFYTQGVCRPRAGMLIGPEQKLYIGFSAHYGHPGGGLAEVDPATEKTRIWLNLVADRSITALATDGELLFLGASTDAEGIQPVVDSACLLIFNPKNEKILATYPIENSANISSICYLPQQKQLLLAIGTSILIFDLTDNQWKDEIKLVNASKKQPLKKFIEFKQRSFIPANKQIWEIDLTEKRFIPFHQARGHISAAVVNNSRLYYSVGAELFVLNLE